MLSLAETVRRPCPHAWGAEAVRTVGDLAAFSIRQEAALSACDARRAAAVETVDAFNAARERVKPGPRRFWPLGRRR